MKPPLEWFIIAIFGACICVWAILSVAELPPDTQTHRVLKIINNGE